jgi:prevent-host-death family protein
LRVAHQVPQRGGSKWHTTVLAAVFGGSWTVPLGVCRDGAASCVGGWVMALYKRFGDLLIVEPPRKSVEEVSIRELGRNPSAVLERLRAGGRAVITNHGTPTAVLMEADEAIGFAGRCS